MGYGKLAERNSQERIKPNAVLAGLAKFHVKGLYFVGTLLIKLFFYQLPENSIPNKIVWSDLKEDHVTLPALHAQVSKEEATVSRKSSPCPCNSMGIISNSTQVHPWNTR